MPQKKGRTLTGEGQRKTQLWFDPPAAGSPAASGAGEGGGSCILGREQAEERGQKWMSPGTFMKVRYLGKHDLKTIQGHTN